MKSSNPSKTPKRSPISDSDPCDSDLSDNENSKSHPKQNKGKESLMKTILDNQNKVLKKKFKDTNLSKTQRENYDATKAIPSTSKALSYKIPKCDEKQIKKRSSSSKRSSDSHNRKMLCSPPPIDSSTDSSAPSEKRAKYDDKNSAVKSSNKKLTSSDEEGNSSNSSSDTKSDTASITKKHKHQDSFTKEIKKEKKYKIDESDDLMNVLNDVQQFTSRDLKTNKKYKLLDIKITEENGFNGPYKKAEGRLEDSKRKRTGSLSIIFPKPVSLLSQDIIQKMNERIAQGKNPHYVVCKITSRERADGKGSYDVVDYKWV